MQKQTTLLAEGRANEAPSQAVKTPGSSSCRMSKIAVKPLTSILHSVGLSLSPVRLKGVQTIVSFLLDRDFNYSSTYGKEGDSDK